VSPLRSWIASFIVAWLLTASVLAQAPASPAEVSLARQEFVAGVEGARTGAWQAAFDHFQRSYALYPHPETLFNMAGAERRLGQLVAAAESYHSYLRLSADQTTPDNRSYAEQALAELSAAMAHVELRVAGVTSTDRVALDGVPLNRAALSAELPVDPGKHVLTVHRGGDEMLRREFWAEPGQVLELSAHLPGSVPVEQLDEPVPAPALQLVHREPPPAYDQPTSRKRMRRIVAFTTLGLAVVGGGVAAYFLTRKVENDEVEGSLGPNVTIP
jgi:hypothetical protein